MELLKFIFESAEHFFGSVILMLINQFFIIVIMAILYDIVVAIKKK